MLTEAQLHLVAFQGSFHGYTGNKASKASWPLRSPCQHLQCLSEGGTAMAEEDCKLGERIFKFLKCTPTENIYCSRMEHPYPCGWDSTLTWEKSERMEIRLSTISLSYPDTPGKQDDSNKESSGRVTKVCKVIRNYSFK